MKIRRAAAARHTRVPELIVAVPLLLVRKHRIRLGDVLEFLLGDGFVVRVAVRMPLLGQRAKRRLDLVGGRIALDAKGIVVVGFLAGHGFAC